MVDVTVYKLSPYGLLFIHDKTLGLSSITSNMGGFMCLIYILRKTFIYTFFAEVLENRHSSVVKRNHSFIDKTEGNMNLEPANSKHAVNPCSSFVSLCT